MKYEQYFTKYAESKAGNNNNNNKNNNKPKDVSEWVKNIMCSHEKSY